MVDLFYALTFLSIDVQIDSVMIFYFFCHSVTFSVLNVNTMSISFAAVVYTLWLVICSL